MNDLSLRNDIQDWWKEATAGKDSYDSHELADFAMAHFKQDPVFCDRFLEAFLRPVIMRIGGEVDRKMRAAVLQNRPRPMPSSIAVKSSPGPVRPTPVEASSPPASRAMPAAEIAEVAIEPAPQHRSRWREWVEQDPESEQRIKVFAMTKRQALNAADQRDAAAMGSLRTSAMLRLMAGPLTRDDAIIESYWGNRTNQLDRMFEDIEVERTRFRLRSLMQGAA